MDTAELENEAFRIAMVWRIGYGTLRTILGFVVLKLVDLPLSQVLMEAMSFELKQDPTHIFFQTISAFLQTHPFTVTKFIALYLIFWGIVDIVLSIFLLRHKLWAFPLSLCLIGFFIVYELYRLLYTHAPAFLFLIIIDSVIFWLTVIEYKRVKNRRTLKYTTQGNN